MILQSYNRLKTLGLTLKPDAVRASVDRIRQSFNDEAIKEKNKITATMNAPVVARRRLFENANVQGITFFLVLWVFTKINHKRLFSCSIGFIWTILVNLVYKMINNKHAI